MTNSGWSEGFRARLELLQGRYGVSKAEMARRCDLPPRTLENYFKGHKPGVDALLSISRGLGVDIDWLLGEAPEAKHMITDLLGEAVFLAAFATMKEVAERAGSKNPDDGSDVFGTSARQVASQLERRAVDQYLLLQKQYSAPSLEHAKRMEASASDADK